MSSHSIVCIVVCGWLLAIGAAAVPTMRHQYTPGVASDAGRWPDAAPFRPATRGPTVVLVAHARCPCAWASLDELSLALAKVPEMRAYVLVATPPGVAPDGRLAARARRLPATEVIADDGTAAASFAVSTSGHTLLFSPSGKLLFSGGITGSRGHRGDNAGLTAMLALATGAPSPLATAPVYGCPLADPPTGDCALCCPRQAP